MRKCKNKKTSHTEAHIAEILIKISYKIPEYLNKNQALFRHKSDMTAELYLVYILGIQANWENWEKKTQTTWDTQKIFLSLQLHIQHLIRSSG